MREFDLANALLSDPAALRQRAREDGCLFFRGLVDPGSIRTVRREILELCAEAGWLDDASPVEAGVARAGVAHVEPSAEFMVVYNRLQRLESFHALAHDEALLAMFGALFDGPVLPHARNIARIIFPRNLKYTTPEHQDFVHIQGTEDTWTAWIPLGDCPRELGSLAVMPGSHREGVLPVHAAYGAGGVGVRTDHLPYEWRGTDFATGDVVVFHSLTVHKALPNETTDRIRLSVDYRYQAEAQPVVQDSFRPHHGQIDWEEVYAGWRSKRLQYYWRDRPIRWVEWSPEHRRTEG